MLTRFGRNAPVFILLLVVLPLLGSVRTWSMAVSTEPIGRVVFSEDFSSDPNTNGKWVIYRATGDTVNEAAWYAANGQFYLVRAVSVRGAAMFANYDLTSRQWEAEFKYRIGGGSGADGLVFLLYKDKQAFTPGGGGSLAVSPSSGGSRPGYGVEWDNYHNGDQGDPSGSHIAITKDTAGVHLASVNDHRTEDNVWHTALIDFDNGRISVEIDGSQVLDYTIADPDYTYTGVGFSASTGSYNHNHIIDDFVLRDLGTPAPFMHSPFHKPDGTPDEQMLLPLNQQGGMITSWFDHETPFRGVGHGGDGLLRDWTAGSPKPNPQGVNECALGSNCYDGHEGTDFGPGEGTDIYPVADGRVVFAGWDTTGYGFTVVVQHTGKGYLTRYSHLSWIDPNIPITVDTATPIGKVGRTGCSVPGSPKGCGPHLHFGVYLDRDGDGLTDTNELVDPYGWGGACDQEIGDPWYDWNDPEKGPPSYYLWATSVCHKITSDGRTEVYVDNTSGSVRVTKPAGSFSGTLTLTDTPVAAPSAQLRSANHAFALKAQDSNGNPITNLAQPFTLTVSYLSADVKHAKPATLHLGRWEPEGAAWLPLNSDVDQTNRIVTATTDHLSDFALWGEPLCADDPDEPNDIAVMATLRPMSDETTTQRFDATNDVDWFAFDAVAGTDYTIATGSLAANTDTVLSLYDLDAQTLIATNDDFAGSHASQIDWTAPEAGRYFVLVTPGAAHIAGCDATYALSINGIAPTPTATPSSHLTVRVSVASDGTQGNGASIFDSARGISDDGHYVAFWSYASNLVSDDTNNASDVFVHDLQSGQTTRVSISSDGSQANGGSEGVSLSADGRYVAFASYASNLVSGHTNGFLDVFVHDRQTSQTMQVSVASDGSPGNSESGSPVISTDGRYVTFTSAASNLTTDDTNDRVDVFVHDRQTDQTTRVSVASDGTQGNDGSNLPAISADGRYVAFASTATNLVNGDTNGMIRDIYLHDRQIPQTTRVSIASSGAQGNDNAISPSISADGRYVAFQSHAINLVSGDTNNNPDIFVHDQLTGQTVRTSVASDGAQGNLGASYPAISADGRYVVFQSDASNLVAADTNGAWDIFVHDRQTSQTTRVSLTDGSAEGNDGAQNTASISANGRYVAFESQASNMVNGDTNSSADVFVRDRCPTGSCDVGTETPTLTPTVTPTPTAAATPAPGVNLALGKPAYASSIEAGLTPGYAFDGDMLSRWSSAASDPQWLYVDLGATYPIQELRLYWEAAYGRDYSIEVSADAANWQEIYHETNGDGGLDSISVSTSGRYVRLYGVQRGTGWGYSLWEFEIYDGTPPTPTPTPTPPPSDNLALGRPGYASNWMINYKPGKAFDGDRQTMWGTEAWDPQWIYVDLGANHTIAQVILRWENAYAKSYQLQVSDDATTWQEIYAQISGIGGTEILNVTATGRYVRLYGVARQTSGWGYGLWEFEVYDKTVATPRPTPSPLPVIAPPAGQWVEVGAGSASGGGISNNSGTSHLPSLALSSGGAPYVVWQDQTAGNWEVCGRWFDGATWQEIGAGAANDGGISNNSGGSGERPPSLALDASNRPYVAWDDTTPGNFEVYARQFDGTSWLEMGAGSASGGGISNHPARSWAPNLAVSHAGVPYVAWTDDRTGIDRVYAEAYNSADGTWTGGLATGCGGNAALAFDPWDTLYLGNRDCWDSIWLTQYDGAHWTVMGGAANASAPGSTAGEQSVAADPAGTTYVAWVQQGNGNWEIYVKRLTLTGWAEVSTGSASGGGISNSSAASHKPSLAIDPAGYPFLAWEEGDRIYVKRFDGANWVEVSPGSASGDGLGAGSSPSMALDALGQPYVAWSSPTGEIFVKRWAADAIATATPTHTPTPTPTETPTSTPITTTSATAEPSTPLTITLPNAVGQIALPAGLVTSTTVFTYSQFGAPMQGTGGLAFAGKSFTLVATDAAGQPVTTFADRYTITLNYSDADWQATGIPAEESLNLYYWNGTNWVGILPCNSCSLDTVSNRITAWLNHLTEFALLGNPLAAPAVSASKETGGVALRWTQTQAGVMRFEVYRSTNPYFTPDSGSLLDGNLAAPGAGNEANFNDPFGEPNVNYYYVIVAVGAEEVRSLASNRVAAFHFGLTPGVQ